MITNRKEKRSGGPDQRKPLRLWPGIIIVLLQWLAWLVLPAIFPETLVFGMFGGLAGGLFVILWWAFFSRAPRIERWGAVALMILSIYVTSLIIDRSIATGGSGMMFYMFCIPFLSLAFVVWAVVTQRLSVRVRRWTMAATIILACGVWILFRNDGITGEFNLDLEWRWAKTSEEKLLAMDEEELTILTTAPAEAGSEAEWPGFRGPGRDGIVRGVRINTDWSASPPVELWRRPVGPGCSSFAVNGEMLYTQEQRGDEEIVSCYSLATGKPIWRHRDEARFWDSHVGAGPRSTPTLSNGRVYTFGATGIINVLDAVDGTVIWSRNAATDTKTKDSGWGFSSSPLVVDSVVIVAATGTLAAYDITTGEPHWYGPDGGDSYSSPHLLVADGMKQILLLSGTGAISIAPADGTVLWEYRWAGDSRIVQPALTQDGDILICRSDGAALRRISVIQEEGNWNFREHWTTAFLKPNFNDFIVHKGHAYGFNGPILVCIDLETGERRWKGKRYGGQILLLADQDLLLVLTEKGKVALVGATPDRFTEIERIDAIEGKTWNHPVLAGDILVVRNTEEMAAFRLPAEER